MSFRKIMAVIICAGIFIIGIGTGISFLEYAGFEYGGSKKLYEGGRTTDLYTLAFDEDEAEEAFIEFLTYSNSVETEVISDSTVSQNQIIFEITYHQDYGIPNVEKRDSEKNQYTIMEERENAKSELEVFMDYKGHWLDDMKNRVVTDYKRDRGWECNIKVSPDNVGKINF